MDSRGLFLMVLPAGEEAFLIREVGYQPQTFAASLVTSDTLRIGVLLARAAVTLPDLVVKAEGTEYRGRLAGFAERMLSSGAPRSAFLTRKDIEGQNSNRLYDLLLRAGMKAGYDSKGREAVTCPRGLSGFRAPRATFYLDGVRVPDGQDVTYFGAVQLEAIEVYGSTATRPPQYNATGYDCVILLWLRDDAR